MFQRVFHFGSQDIAGHPKTICKHICNSKVSWFFKLDLKTEHLTPFEKCLSKVYLIFIKQYKRRKAHSAFCFWLVGK